jgi:BR-signaling kinase
MFALQAIDMIRGKNITLLMDSHLEGNFSTEEATVVVGLASQCLQYEPRERPSTKDLVTTLAPLQTKPDVRKFNRCHLFWFFNYQFKLSFL